MFSSERAQEKKTLTFLIRYILFCDGSCIQNRAADETSSVHAAPNRTGRPAFNGKGGRSGASLFWLLQMGSALLSPPRAARMVVAIILVGLLAGLVAAVRWVEATELWRRGAAYPDNLVIHSWNRKALQGNKTRENYFCSARIRLVTKLTSLCLSFLCLVAVM